jgi:hypothetical protein
MKYIKSYENIEIPEKYAILKFGNYDSKEGSFIEIYFWIIEIIDIFKKDLYYEYIKFKKIYIYKNDKLVIVEPDNWQILDKPSYMIKKRMLYQSNNLQECIDMIEPLLNTFKYNI